MDDEDEYYQEVLGSGQSDEEEGQAEQPEFTALRQSKRSDPLVAATGQEIAALVAWGRGYRAPAGLPPDGADRVPGRDLPPGRHAGATSGSWCSPSTPPRLDWIADVLAQRGYRTATSWRPSRARRPPRTARTIRARFTADPDKQPVRVLVATDSAGEGIDLQDYCHRLVNFDIPFNPSRLEQRIGRIDRYGQHKRRRYTSFSPDSTDPRRTPRTWGSCADM